METLFEQNLAWAEKVARNVARSLPPSFDVEDLKQIARIAHWKRVQLYDPAGPHAGVPYQAYAISAVRGAVLMACRRRHYRDATAEELSDHYVDARLTPEQEMLRKEEARNRSGRRERRRAQAVRQAVLSLPAADTYVLKRIYLEGADVKDLERFVPDLKKRIMRARRLLKRALGSRRSEFAPA